MKSRTVVGTADSPGVREAPMNFPDRRNGKQKKVGASYYRDEDGRGRWRPLRVYLGNRKVADLGW